MKPLPELITIYRDLLNNMWDKMCQLSNGTEGDSLPDDWKQANWELIVEMNLEDNNIIYLEPYGAGADFYGTSSWIFEPKALPTHAVHCCSNQLIKDQLTGHLMEFLKNGYLLDCFVTIVDGWYYEKPPFDSVLIIKDEDQFVFDLKDIYFKLIKL